MRVRSIRYGLGLAFVLLAVAAVLPGIGRLFEKDAQAPVVPERVRVYTALLTAVNSTAQEQAQTAEKSAERPGAPAVYKDALSAYARPLAARDANGNVITRRAYYQCVPEAFTPSDAKT